MNTIDIFSENNKYIKVYDSNQTKRITEKNSKNIYDFNDSRIIYIENIKEDNIIDLSIFKDVPIYRLIITSSNLDNIIGMEHLSKLKKLSIRSSIKSLNDNFSESFSNSNKSLNSLNKIHSFGFKISKNFPDLENLTLIENNIEVLENLNFSKLKELFYKKNNTKIIGNNNLPELTDLTLMLNQFEDINKINSFKNLENLIIKTSIQNIQKLENLDLPKLKKLDCEYNDLFELGKNILPELENLRLNNNYLKNIENVKYFESLKYLCADDNQLENMSGIEFLNKLETLSLRENKITQIEGIENLNPIDINLSNNNIHTLENLPKNDRLNQIRLYNNPLSWSEYSKLSRKTKLSPTINNKELYNSYIFSFGTPKREKELIKKKEKSMEIKMDKERLKEEKLLKLKEENEKNIKVLKINNNINNIENTISFGY